MSWESTKALMILVNSMSAFPEDTLKDVDESYKRYMENETTRTDKRT